MNTSHALGYAGLPKSTWYRYNLDSCPRESKARQIDDSEIISLIKAIAAERPTYGTRRMAVMIKRKTNIAVNRKKMQRIYRKMGWISPKTAKNEKIAAAYKHREKPDYVPTAPNQLWETDITYIHCGRDGWCYSFNVVDVFSRRWLAYVFSPVATKHQAIESILKAVSTVDDTKNLMIRCDNGTQYTSKEFRESMKNLGITIEYIWTHTPQQNGHIESFHGKIKMDYIWLHEFERFQDAEPVLAAAFEDYNKIRPHSSLSYMSPDQFLNQWNREHGGTDK